MEDVLVIRLVIGMSREKLTSTQGTFL